MQKWTRQKKISLDQVFSVSRLPAQCVLTLSVRGPTLDFMNPSIDGQILPSKVDPRTETVKYL